MPPCVERALCVSVCVCVLLCLVFYTYIFVIYHRTHRVFVCFSPLYIEALIVRLEYSRRVDNHSVNVATPPNITFYREQRVQLHRRRRDRWRDYIVRVFS